MNPRLRLALAVPVATIALGTAVATGVLSGPLLGEPGPAYAEVSTGSPLPPGVTPGDVVRESRGTECAERNGAVPELERTYIVQPGDTLSKIARSADRTVEQMLNGNCDVVRDPDLIRPGMRLFL